jgi:hypothetical protein
VSGNSSGYEEKGPGGAPIPVPEDDQADHYAKVQAQLREPEQGGGQIVPKEEKPTGIVSRVRGAVAKRREEKAAQEAQDLQILNDFRNWRSAHGEKRALDLVVSTYGIEGLQRIRPYLAHEAGIRGSVDLAKAKARGRVMKRETGTTEVVKGMRSGNMFVPRWKDAGKMPVRKIPLGLSGRVKVWPQMRVQLMPKGNSGFASFSPKPTVKGNARRVVAPRVTVKASGDPFGLRPVRPNFGIRPGIAFKPRKRRQVVG